MKTKKWKLSSYWWANFWFLLALSTVAEAGLLWMQLRWEPSAEDKFLIPSVFMPGMVLVFLLCALHPWRFLMTMEADGVVFRSYLFGRLCCEVFTDRPVYYARMEFDEHNSIDQPYIAISNHPFRVKARDRAFFPLKSSRFIDYYDRKTVIIFPYNERTRALFAPD